MRPGSGAHDPEIKEYQELQITAPDSALPPPIPVPRGMSAWRNAKNGFVVVACHYTSDPEKCSNDWYFEACRNLRPDQIERELEINFDSKAGTKAFPFLEYHEGHFRRDPPSPIPSNWKIIVGLDYGSRNPTSAHFYAIDDYRRFWAFDEFYAPMQSVEGGLPAFAKWLKTHKYWDRVKHVVADPSIFNKNQNVLEMKETGKESVGTLMSIADILLKDCKIYKLQRGNNDRMAGLERVRQMLNWQGDTRVEPFLLIGRKCQKAWWELNNIVYRLDDKDTKNPEEDVVKRNDHFFDELKYSLLSIALPAGAPKLDAKNGQQTLSAIEEEIDEKYAEENKSILDAAFANMDESYDQDLEAS